MHGHGVQVYCIVWEAVVGETLLCERERQNTHGRYAVAVKKDRVIFGHLPRSVSCVRCYWNKAPASSVLSYGLVGTLLTYLNEGGLDIPCLL